MRRGMFLLASFLLVARVFAQEPDTAQVDPAFFPIAVWAQNPANALAYKQNGINMFISIHGGLDKDKMDYLKKAGMKVIAHQNSFGLTQLHEPLIYAWMHGDEPDNAQRNRTANKWDPCRDPAD